MLPDRLDDAVTLLQQAKHVVALTGAGISTPSGIPDFRSAGSGLWDNADMLNAANIQTFIRQPEIFYQWMRPLARAIIAAQPNAAHLALTHLELYGPLQSVITQNVDLLHHRAGSRVVHELHGHIREATCIQCYEQVEAEPLIRAYLDSGELPRCRSCGGVLKPNVILYGEQLPVSVLNAARREARRCDLMLIAGTSLEVAPACDFPIIARDAGARLIVVNQEPTWLDDFADVAIRANVMIALPRLAAPFVPAGKNVLSEKL